MDTLDEARAAAIRAAIARARARYQVRYNQELAQRMGIPVKHFSRWQNGRFTRLDRVLIDILLTNEQQINA